MSQPLDGNIESLTKVARSKSSTVDSTENLPSTTSVENSPVLPSLYEDRMRRLLQLNPPLATNRVHIPWYRRYVDVIPEKDQQYVFQPYREIQTRDEDIALQHQFGYHECMQEYVTRGMCRYPPAECKKFREAAMTRYNRIRKREQEKKEKKKGGGPQQEDGFVLPGQDIDFATEFGFSANKKQIVAPVVDFLLKLHVQRERDALRRRLTSGSNWNRLNTTLRQHLRELIKVHRRKEARNRIRRLFSLVLCVHRFIKCVAMIAGDTQTLLKDTTHRSFLHVRVKCSTDDRPEKEIAFFNVHNYLKAVQIQVPFHIQMILGKPWFCRTNKEVETAVKFLEKMRCFTAYPRPFQFMLARVAWYLELPTQKVVIRQSQQAVNFYLLLNGTVKIDRLEGSSCDKENGHFVTLRVLSSQDMFGDECVTQPFSERWYTATTEEKCAALDFNMHDYNNMIQTANTSEEAPDHIRFLCKLRIMDNFPKIKLLREQDNNVTYFFFRPGTLVCRSVRESPFIFVVRNGSCAVLQELKPRIPTDRRSTLISTPGASGVTIDSFSSNLGGVAKMSRSFQGSKIFDDFPNRSSGDGKDWFEKTRASFDQSKLGISDSIRNIKDKAELITKTLSTEHLERFNLEDKSKPEEYPIRRSIGSRASLRWKLQESPTQEGGMSSTSFTDLEIGKKLSGSFSGRLTLGNDMVSSDIQSKRSKIVGTNIQLTPDKIINERKLSQSWSSNLNNSARSRQNVALATIREPTTSTRQGSRLSKTSALPVSGGKNLSAVPMSGGRNSSAVPMSGGRNSSAVPMSASRKSVAARGEADYPLSKYSQWTQKALLTVTDVAGVDWLDYNDGTYNPPKEDTSLISHGATIIMIKKDFMLKYLRRTW